MKKINKSLLLIALFITGCSNDVQINHGQDEVKALSSKNIYGENNSLI